jgi:hypothetical protein
MTKARYNKITGNTQVYTRDRYANRDPEVAIATLIAPDEKARLAMVLLEKWGMVQAHTDGEDSAGRAKLALMPVHEVVGRACEMADLAWREFERLGWVVPIPPIPVNGDDAEDGE